METKGWNPKHQSSFRAVLAPNEAILLDLSLDIIDTILSLRNL